jgi:hypothetical protein
MGDVSVKGYKIMSLCIYNRVLTQPELTKNANLYKVFAIDSISSNVGPSFGGTNLTFTGTALDTISNISIDSNTCYDPSITGTTTYKCKLPANDITEDSKVVDIVISYLSNNTYTLPKTDELRFEYVRVSRQPIRGNVEVS